jgi:hypothetical protein
MLAQFIITRCIRKCSVPGSGIGFISSNAQIGFGDLTASQSIGSSGPFVGVRHWGVKFTNLLY